MTTLIESLNKLPAYTRKGVVELAPVLDAIRDKKVKKLKVLSAIDVNVQSLRLQTFATKGLRCVACGCEGTHFAVERSYTAPDKTPFHLNLYATLSTGEEVLMTRDHIVPSSWGGPDTLENSQTMCGPCNWKKSNCRQGI